MKSKNVRLSKNIIPIEYSIELRPDLENFTFQGAETITVSILKATKSITLHSKEIEIDTVNIMIDGEKVFAKITYDEKLETATFLFSKNIKVGKSKLTLVFKGILNDKMRGFYRSTYYIDGKEHHMATTQFEATDARRAFPCFDEPAHKAVFHVSLVVPKGKTAISNTLPVSVLEHEARYKGHQIVKFSPTPKMSTYLLAFIVGDFEYIEAKTKSGARKSIRVRVLTTPGKKHQAKFALGCAIKILEFYEKYFDIAYPLPVLDMIAIPDFSSGAMENWGAITYRESAILVDESHSSTSNKQWVALVVAHEIAHQWFGNLVTMEWWTHLWLNEGFASYIEYLAVDKLFPKWDIWTQFCNNDLGVALRLDALANTHPIEVEVHHPDEIGEIFDEVSYSKGASIIRMLADYLGEKNFRDSLRYYLKKHSYKNTATVQLWQAFEKVSKKPVTKIMRNWTGKSGYPVIHVRVKNGHLNLSQERFFASPLSKKKYKEKSMWEIPISIGSQNSSQAQLLNDIAQTGAPRITKNQQIFMSVEQKLVPRKNFEENDGWTKINVGETGFFRTAYSKELLEKLKTPVKNKILFARDRLGIIRDLFALAEAGTIPTTDALGFLSSYKNEDSYTVWLELAIGLGRLEQLIASPQARHPRPPKNKASDKFNQLILNLFSPLASRLGWSKKDGEIHTDGFLRSLAISRAGRAGDEKIIAEARKKFLLTKKGHVHPDIRGAIYSIVATHGAMKEYNMLVKKYKEETLHEEKNRLGNALGDFKDPKILKNICEFAMSKNVRTQDTVGILSGVGANPFGRDIWWEFVRKNWKTLVSRYGEGGLALGRAVKAISGSAEPRHLSSFKKFFASHDAPGAKRSIEQVLERLEGNVVWLKRDEEIIEDFLRNK